MDNQKIMNTQANQEVVSEQNAKNTQNAQNVQNTQNTQSTQNAQNSANKVELMLDRLARTNKITLTEDDSIEIKNQFVYIGGEKDSKENKFAETNYELIYSYLENIKFEKQLNIPYVDSCDAETPTYRGIIVKPGVKPVIDFSFDILKEDTVRTISPHRANDFSKKAAMNGWRHRQIDDFGDEISDKTIRNTSDFGLINEAGRYYKIFSFSDISKIFNIKTLGRILEKIPKYTGLNGVKYEFKCNESEDITGIVVSCYNEEYEKCSYWIYTDVYMSDSNYNTFAKRKIVIYLDYALAAAGPYHKRNFSSVMTHTIDHKLIDFKGNLISKATLDNLRDFEGSDEPFEFDAVAERIEVDPFTDFDRFLKEVIRFNAARFTNEHTSLAVSDYMHLIDRHVESIAKRRNDWDGVAFRAKEKETDPNGVKLISLLTDRVITPKFAEDNIPTLEQFNRAKTEETESFLIGLTTEKQTFEL